MTRGRGLGTRIAFVAAASAGVLAAALLVHAGGPDSAPAAPAGPAAPAAPQAPLPAGQVNLPAPGQEEHYTLSIGGVAAGALETRYAAAGEGSGRRLEFQYTITPTGGVQWIWDFKLTGRTLVDVHTLRAQSARFTSRSGQREKTTTVRFDPAAGMANVEVSRSDSDKVKTKQVPITSGLDVPAALLLLRTRDWTAEPATFQVLAGDNLYEWQVSYLRRERIVVPAGAFNTDVVLVKARKLDPKAGYEAAAEDKVQTMQVWLARDTGQPVRVTADLSLGVFQADLTSASTP